jgi:hypothetical protein
MSERTGSALLLGGYHVGAEMKGNSFLASRDVACVWGVVGAMEGFFFLVIVVVCLDFRWERTVAKMLRWLVRGGLVNTAGYQLR